MNKIYKYDSDNLEPHATKYLFNPIAEFIVPILYKLKFTPNIITLISSIITVLASYCLIYGKLELCGILFFIAFLLDCSDGIMARKYKMYSKFGEAFDCTTDMITLIPFMACFIYHFIKIYPLHILIIKILVLSTLLPISYGVMEALSNFKKFKHDNYYEEKKKRFRDKKGLIYRIYILLNKMSYDRYKWFFPKMSLKDLTNLAKKTRWFGDGNLNMLVIIYLFLHSQFLHR